ncbi:hypothetical protein AHAS_Ahas01G0130300 [Arachis hypogaea]
MTTKNFRWCYVSSKQFLLLSCQIISRWWCYGNLKAYFLPNSNRKKLEMYSSFEIFRNITSRLCNLKVLMIFDNVNQLEELEKLIINSLCTRNRVIITTRNVHILSEFGVDAIYKEYAF